MEGEESACNQVRQSVRTMPARGASRDAPSIMAWIHASPVSATVPLRAALVAMKVAYSHTEPSGGHRTGRARAGSHLA